MSGLLRRIKRSRAADAGETPAEGQAAAPEGAPTTAPTAGAVGERPWASGEARTAELPAGAAASPIQADPAVPAGLDPAEAAVQPPAGRRSRLRRRLRYLRRARELMLRDLGGLIFEIHRTAGGDVGAHSGVVGAKLQRLASVDAEAHAIEAALAAPRGDAVVFEPGVGGTCEVCGELYGSDARFCSNCGSPTGSATHAEEPGRTVPGMPKHDATTEPETPHPPEPDETRAPEAAAEPGKTRELAAAPEPDETGALDAAPEPDETRDLHAKPAANEPAGAGEGAGETGSDGARNAFSGLRNGRADDREPPGPSPGDPLGARESRS